jgi:hypothetical protein
MERKTEEEKKKSVEEDVEPVNEGEGEVEEILDLDEQGNMIFKEMEGLWYLLQRK